MVDSDAFGRVQLDAQHQVRVDAGDKLLFDRSGERMAEGAREKPHPIDSEFGPHDLQAEEVVLNRRIGGGHGFGFHE